ncbi:ATP-binding protein [Streptomyces sp. NPDC008222]|uniref:ATP-binding protein n=1 Tax=Streptomyces sp. NPDC008222 TaxID=3364820 RepID=UPI0036EF3AD4
MRPVELPAQDGGNRVFGERTTAASARAHVLAVVRGHRGTSGRPPAEQAVTDLLLVTSELVSNAIRHGGGVVAFEATPTRDGIRLTVHDRSPDIPTVAFGPGALPAGHDGGGYGWPLIIKLAYDIVIEPCADGGKAVSVVVPLGTGPEPAG